MTDHTTHTTDDTADDCTLDRFERNRYFNGKLMTARDMAAEQRYHRGQLRTLSRTVAGDGVVSGLETTLSREDGGLTVAVDPGYALDCCGRPVVVPGDREKPVDDADVLNASVVSVYLVYDSCYLESVPVEGSENACEDECAYNRVLEIYDVEVRAGEPPESHRLSVPAVDFPSREDLETVADRERPDPTDPGLATIAESFATLDAGDGSGCEDPRVLVGVFERGAGDSYDRLETLPGNRVYSNDLLYAATAHHTADFGNPHEVTLESGSTDGGASVAVRDDGDDGHTVSLESMDSSVDISHTGGGAVDFSIEASMSFLSEQIVEILDNRMQALREQHIQPLERHTVEQALKYKALVFRRAAERFGNATASQISRFARLAVDDRLTRETDAEAAEERTVTAGDGTVLAEYTGDVYRELLEDLHERETTFATQVGPQVTDASAERLDLALDRLDDAISMDPPRTVHLAAAQEDVCDAVEWLEPLQDEDDTVFEPGTLVVDSEDPRPDTAVVLRELDVPSSDWRVYTRETVADHNPDRDIEEPVVVVSFLNILDEEWEDWREADASTLYDQVVDRGIKFHAFPRSRLDRVQG